MSTTFDVFAKNNYIPFFNELFSISTENLNNFLKRHGIMSKIFIRYKLMNKVTDNVIPISSDDAFFWDDEHYLWIYTDEVEDGTDAYVHEVDDLDLEELKETEFIQNQEKPVENFIKQNYYWSFRRSAGQPGIINIMYGIIAGTLAKLTDGIVFSGDCAWEIEAAFGDDFLLFYMEPDKTQDEESRKWAIECINSVNS